ncbi:MAG: TonB-dependent receptor [Chitinophagales bacterium]|nr:TonB-dependent receptor [Chitinophagales bacterium]MDW8419164.1 TonB-dependent receptor [Chitinophagales bacterium]
MRNLLLFPLLLLFFELSAQQTVTGIVLEEVTTEPATNAILILTGPDTTITTTTNNDGKFTVNVPSGRYRIELQIGDEKFLLKDGVSTDRWLTNAGVLFYKKIDQEDDRQNIDNIPVLEVSDVDEKDGTAQNVSSALNASRDPYLSQASFIFSATRFRIRGYEPENFVTYINGLPMNDVDDGGTVWAQWSGLNNVMWNRDNTIGIAPTTFAFGGVGGANAFDARAGKQRRQLQLSYAVTNRNYRQRLMATYSTGIIKGWAVSVSASRRWAAEGYVPGTFFDGYSYFLSVEKILRKHSIALTAFGAPTRNGRQTSSVQEAYNLAGSNYYNPLWGYQNGRKRNSSIAITHMPVIILTHEAQPSNKTNIETSLGFTFGKRTITGIDWNNAPDPRPDYYRYLPSFIGDTLLRALAEKEWRENENVRQINWQKLYEANFNSVETIQNVDGIPGNTVTGKRARYIIEGRTQDTRKLHFASTLNQIISDNVSLSCGVTYLWQQIRNYKTVEDLLGADFYVDVNQFAERDFPDNDSMAQNDLNRPNRLLKTGDRWGYDYYANVHRGAFWAVPCFRFNHVDFYVGTELSYTTFWRKGNVRNGLFPDNSFGRSAIQQFFNYAFKAGITGKINGRNYVFAHGVYMTRAPFFDNSFVSIRTRNEVARGLTSEQIYGGEIGYRHTAPRLKVKADFFYTQFNNQTQTTPFYSDLYRTFINYTLTNMDTRHWGFEAGAEVKIYKGFSAVSAISIGRYQYTDRMIATVTQDNNAEVRSTETVYSKRFNVGGTPQLASTFGIQYRDPKFWFINVNFSYYDWMWLNFNPVRRTLEAIDGLDQNSTEFKEIFYQNRLQGHFIMDMFAGYSWLLNKQFPNLKKKYFLVFNVGVNNITNNRQFITGGFEQLRFDFTGGNADKFAPRYFYMYGTTYFINVAFRMQ